MSSGGGAGNALFGVSSTVRYGGSDSIRDFSHSNHHSKRRKSTRFWGATVDDDSLKDGECDIVYEDELLE